jgi:hypothetical protein
MVVPWFDERGQIGGLLNERCALLGKTEASFFR